MSPECGFADKERTVRCYPTVARYDIGDPNPDGWRPCSLEEQKANARLIADAPRLARMAAAGKLLAGSVRAALKEKAGIQGRLWQRGRIEQDLADFERASKEDTDA